MRQKTIFFVYSYNTPYILQDLHSLQKHFRLIPGDFSRSGRKLNLLPSMMHRIYQGIRNSNISIVWFADFRAFITILVSLILKKKVIVIIGGYEVVSLPEYKYGGLRNPWSRFKVNFILRKASRILAVSSFSQKEIMRLIAEDKVVTIPLGTDPQPDCKIGEKKKIILTVGQATRKKYKIKGLDLFARIAAKIDDYRFVIVGDSDEETRMELLQIGSNLEFTGQLDVEELKSWYRRSRFYCQLSLRESFGYSLLEAMSFGCIPVVTDVGALPEVVGSSGIILKDRDPEKAVEAIRKVVRLDSDPPRKQAKENFSLDSRMTGLTELIEELT